MFLIDAGTSYIKIAKDGVFSTINISQNTIPALKDPTLVTGHNARLFSNSDQIIVNELIALSEGAKKIIGIFDFTVIDIGSRDVKLIEYKNNKFEKCDWNTNCGAMVGFTIDLMMKYFNMSNTELPDTDKIFDVTCGLLGITKFFDSVGEENNIDEAMSALIAGLARFVWQFAGKPQTIYLSGGLTEHKCFLMHLRKFVPELYPLGRFVLLKGLEEILKERSKLK